MEQLLAVLPFGGTLDLVQLKGSTLRKLFEFSVRRYGQGGGEFLQVSGSFLAPSSGLALKFRRRSDARNHRPQGSAWSWTSPNLRGAA